VLECVVNVSEGRNPDAIAAIAAAAGADLLDVHTDPHHHRSVLTLVGEDTPRRVTTAAIERIDLAEHDGVHPRLGAVDVVPFVPLHGSTEHEARRARDDYMTWLADAHDVPSFLYGPERTLPEVRRRAFRDLVPDRGPRHPHPTAGATCVGVRAVLVAYNVWVDHLDLAQARQVASAIRRPELRTLGLAVGDRVQVSMNLVAPLELGPETAFDLVVAGLGGQGSGVRAELVGLVPRQVLEAIDPERWDELDLSADRTIEARLAARRPT
jgi:glutamate formiminotransferase